MKKDLFMFYEDVVSGQCWIYGYNERDKLVQKSES